MAKKDFRGGVDWDVFVRDKYCCVYCGLDMMVIGNRWDLFAADHLVPKAKGGPDTLTNLVTACLGCNRLKSGFDPTNTEDGIETLTEGSRNRLIERARKHIESERRKWDADAQAMLKEAGRI
jgi:5-methylcytosine-specific restriction endonuclease McrA